MAVPKVPCVNTLVYNTDEYCKYKSDVISDMLVRHLQDLSFGEDTRIFNPAYKETTKIYLCLHQLISTLDPHSDVLWAAVRVVEKCCSSSSARTALVSQYKFIAPLTDLLLANLTPENKTNVLRIVLEMTKETELLQKETSLQSLISMLIEFIMTEGADIGRWCLRILVNICHNKTFLIHSLKSYISGRFFKTVMNLKDDTISTKLQICKLLFVLEPISLAVDGPPDIAKTILDITFSNFIEAFEKNNVMLLHDVVEFFKELASLPVYTDLLCSYDRCPQYTQNMLHSLEGCKYEIVFEIFDFLYSLLSVKVPVLRPIYPQIMRISFSWLQTDKICIKALGILTSILQDMDNNTTDRSSIIDLVEKNLSNILQLYITTDGSEAASCHVALLQFLQEIIKYEELREQLLQTINLQRMEEILCEFSMHKADIKNHTSVMMLHVCVLNFISSIAEYDSAYIELRDKLFHSPDVQKTLAMSFYEVDVMSQVLSLVSKMKLSEESLCVLAKSLSTSVSETGSDGASKGSSHVQKDTSFDVTKCSSVSLIQGSQIDALVDATMQKLGDNQMEKIPISTVMTLLEYKIAAASRTEQNLNSSREIASNHCTEMQQRLEEINSRIAHMRDLFLKNQKHGEFLHAEVQELTHIVEMHKNSFAQNQRKYREELDAKKKKENLLKLECDDLKQKGKALEELKKTLAMDLVTTNLKINSTIETAKDHSSHIISLEQKIQEQESQYIDQMEKLNSLKSVLKCSKEVLCEREAEAANFKKEKTCLEVEVANLQMVRKAQEKTASEKDKEIEEFRKELSELKRIRDVILDISRGGKKKSKE